MANHSSAKKATRQSERQHARNKSTRSALRTYVRKAERLIASKELDEASPAVAQAVVSLDRAAQKGVIHPNNAARGKSRLMHKFNVAKTSAASN